jgi:ubiquinone/menaquinone biosynthesis C-methylase UbiE
VSGRARGAADRRGFAWFGLISPDGAFATDVLGPSIAASVGFGLCLGPVVATATAGVAPGDAGTASALLNSSRQIGASLGLAALGTAAHSRTGQAVTAGSTHERYVRAAGRFGITALYDTAIGLTMREEAWRMPLAHAATAGARDGDVLDVGCGTGALTHALALAAPDARITGLDGDRAVLARARRRLARCPRVTLLEGRADNLPFPDDSFDRVTCALLLHHLSPATQRAALSEAGRVLRPGGQLHVADWGRPRGLLGPAAALVLRMLDGFENTGPPVRGELPAMLREAGFAPVAVTRRLAVVWGTLELLRGELPG